MQKITIKESTLDLVAKHAIGSMVTKYSEIDHINKTITIEIGNELHDTLSDEIDDITPTINDVIVMLCSGGKINRSQPAQ